MCHVIVTFLFFLCKILWQQCGIDLISFVPCLDIYKVMAILRKLPQETKKKLSAKGYFPQDGYILQYLPVPPNCLSVPDVSDGISTMSTVRHFHQM